MKNSQQTPASSSKAKLDHWNKLVPIVAVGAQVREDVEKEMRVKPDEQEEEEQPPRKKSRGSISTEAWKSLEWDAEKWWSFLDEKGIDKQAQQQLFLLAQLGDDGKREANKLFSKMTDPSFWKMKPSAWLSHSVMLARQGIEEARQ